MVFDERYIGMLWRKWRHDNSTVPSDWANSFEFLTHVYGEGFFPAKPRRLTESAAVPPAVGAGLGYVRRFGHLHARLDPLEIAQPVAVPISAEPDCAALAYTETLTVETGHLDDPEMLDWVIQAFEAIQAAPSRPDAAILWQLIDTEVFDAFLAAKHAAKKRFGSEGADAFLPLLHALRNCAARAGVDEIVMGSMHRGRLSLLANFAGMPLERLLAMIAGEHPFPDREDLPADVPYHFGHQGNDDGVPLTLLPNPSHLEAINPVVVGWARARRTEGTGNAMAVIIHTDASVVGQGVNAELLQMSGLAGFDVGGTVHLVINNQVGFTTNPDEARTSRYCSGPWRAVDSLLLHVNGDDVDACIRAVSLAVSFRERFNRDVVIDLVCYRRNGHNEIDEPRFTQPLYYDVADHHLSAIDQYERRLIECGDVSRDDAIAYRLAVKAKLDRAMKNASAACSTKAPILRNARAQQRWSADDLRAIVEVTSAVAEGDGHPKMIKLLQRRTEEFDTGINWALAETMALGAILQSGMSVRLCGQDVERGPFSQRHLAAIQPGTGLRQQLLSRVSRDGARFECVNSPLSEYAVLGFEYGYSLGSAGTFCIWEAQFGDFLNGAQIMIDQIITSGFEKWMQTSNMTLLLPHGLEGQGPEHSSARIERLLQLCARNNIAVAHPSTPANYFHLLHAQAFGGKCPLFVVTPKKLLRLPQARSAITDFTGDSDFQPVIANEPPEMAERAILCSGKIAYELEALAEELAVEVAVVRIERLYPWPVAELTATLKSLGVSEMLWLQEEPANYGAGLWLWPRLRAIADDLGIALLPMVTRPEAASPAGGFHNWHDRDQAALLARALASDDIKQAQGLRSNVALLD